MSNSPSGFIKIKQKYMMLAVNHTVLERYQQVKHRSGLTWKNGTYYGYTCTTCIPLLNTVVSLIFSTFSRGHKIPGRHGIKSWWSCRCIKLFTLAHFSVLLIGIQGGQSICCTIEISHYSENTFKMIRHVKFYMGLNFTFVKSFLKLVSTQP